MVECERNHSLIGERFPKMVVETTHGKKILPDDYVGSWFILFSHPGDFTPVCTTEFISFQRRIDKFASFNTELIGLSLDTVFAHMKWIEWIRHYFHVAISFPIIADELGAVAKRLGMIAPARGTQTVRTVYIVDLNGIVRLMLNYPPEIGRNVDELLRVIQALQIATENNVAVPANWPQNEYLHSHVILPPPTNVFDAQKRIEQAKAGEHHCLDWWFCYKSYHDGGTKDE